MAFRMNIRRTKAVVWVLNIGAILGIFFLFLAIYKEKAAGSFNPQNPKIYLDMIQSGINVEIKSGPNEININDYNALWNASISGIKRQVEAPKIEDEVVEVDEDPLADIVEVMVVLKSPIPEESRIRLNYPKSQENNEKPFKLLLWLKEGDPLKPPYDSHPYYAKVEKIETDHVVFSYRGESVSLIPQFAKERELSESSSPAKTSSLVSRFPVELLTRFPEPPEETVEYEPDHFYLSPKDTNVLATDWESELKSTPVVAIKNKKTGKTELTLTSVPEDSMAAKRGFVKNDVLISINGTPVHTKASAINYFNEHPNDGTYVVQFRRSGRLMTKTFVTPPAE
ncbi:MAG: PDZ domain-containing protein [Planctomycetes bacterium]|nr:PDZ domain-containing protein [Planctomycetota bacterium]